MAEILNNYEGYVMPLRLKTTDEFLTRSKSGTIWGRVYFENDGHFFPEQEWTDMVVPFLTAWLEALVRIATGSSTRENVWFMDGPFQIALSAESEKIVELKLMNRDFAEQSAEATIEELLHNAVSNSKELLTSCHKRGWNDNETTMLADVTNQGAEALGG